LTKAASLSGFYKSERAAFLTGAVVRGDDSDRIGKRSCGLEFEEPGQVLVGMIEHGSIGRLQADEEALLVSAVTEWPVNLEPFDANTNLTGVRLRQSRTASSDGMRWNELLNLGRLEPRALPCEPVLLCEFGWIERPPPAVITPAGRSDHGPGFLRT